MIISLDYAVCFFVSLFYGKVFASKLALICFVALVVANFSQIIYIYIYIYIYVYMNSK